MVGNSNQSVARPSREPVHRAAAEEAWKLQSSCSKFLSNLKNIKEFFVPINIVIEIEQWQNVSIPADTLWVLIPTTDSC